MSEMQERVAEGIKNSQPFLQLTSEQLLLAARAAIAAMRELPSQPGPRYTAGEYSRRTQDAMIDDALNEKSPTAS